jgi:hypothetical protein
MQLRNSRQLGQHCQCVIKANIRQIGKRMTSQLFRQKWKIPIVVTGICKINLHDVNDTASRMLKLTELQFCNDASRSVISQIITKCLPHTNFYLLFFYISTSAGETYTKVNRF